MDDSVMVGNAGEFYVLAELTRRGWTAGPTPRNSRAYDIIARKGDTFASLRVKTKTAKSEVFRWNAKKSGQVFLNLSRRRDFCVLVDIPSDDSQPTYYIVPTHRIDRWLHRDFVEWKSAPGKNGRKHDPDNRIRLFYVDDRVGRRAHGYARKLKRYRHAWHRLERR